MPTEAIPTATMPTTARRRAILAAAPALAFGAAPAAAANPDAVLIRAVADLIADAMANDAKAAPLADKLIRDWTQADHEDWQAIDAGTARYLSALDEIADARPSTPEGLAAQALAAAWHLRFEDGGEAEDRLALALVRGVLSLTGQPVPAWAQTALEATRQAAAASEEADPAERQRIADDARIAAAVAALIG